VTRRNIGKGFDMLDQKVAEILKSKLGDEKITIDGKETGLFDLVADWEDGLTKTKATNANLKAEKDEIEKAIKESKEKLARLDKYSSLTDDDLDKLSKVKKGGMMDKDQVSLQIAKLEDTLKSVTDKLTNAEKLAVEQSERAKLARIQSAQEKLRSDIVTELNKNKIVGDQADAVYALMEKKGLFSIKDIDGTGEKFDRVFIAKKDGRDMASDLESLCKSMAETNKWAVSPSGVKGPGDEHQNTPPVGGKGIDPMSLLRSAEGGYDNQKT